jgi:RNA polymerase sigma factor (sigma-70 family)
MDRTAANPLDSLVRAAAGGDRDAFADVVDRTRTLVCSIAMAILRDVEASQDVAQDVFLSAWRDLRKLREPASFLPWLRQMTRNRAHHVLRSRGRPRATRAVGRRCRGLVALVQCCCATYVDQIYIAAMSDGKAPDKSQGKLQDKPPGKPLGFATVTVLHAVASGSAYGFDICDVTGLPSGTVYPALSRLDQAGFVRSRWERQDIAQREKRPPRRYYEITAQGSTALATALDRYRALEPVTTPWRKPARSRS